VGWHHLIFDCLTLFVEINAWPLEASSSLCWHLLIFDWLTLFFWNKCLTSRGILLSVLLVWPPHYNELNGRKQSLSVAKQNNNITWDFRVEIKPLFTYIAQIRACNDLAPLPHAAGCRCSSAGCRSCTPRTAGAASNHNCILGETVNKSILTRSCYSNGEFLCIYIPLWLYVAEVL
jgi:hypothetical protein